MYSYLSNQRLPNCVLKKNKITLHYNKGMDIGIKIKKLKVKK